MCGSNYNFQGKIISSLGTYYDTLTASNGCDSVITHTLIPNEIPRYITNAFMCNNGQFYSFYGKLYNVQGIYTDTLYNKNCIIQIRTLNLTVHPLPTKPNITWNGTFFTSSSAINNQWFRNDTIIAGATSQTYTPTKGGDYFVQVTDSNFFVNNSTKYLLWNLSAVDSRLRGNDGGIEVFPNPSEGIFTIEYSSHEKEELAIYNILEQ